MDKFDYINRKIDNLEDEIDVAAFKFRGTEDGVIEIYKKRIELNILKEIKIDLIAWDVIKTCFEYESGDFSLGSKRGFYQTRELSNAECKALAKALGMNYE